MCRLATLEEVARFEGEPQNEQQVVTHHHLLCSTVEEFDNGMYVAPKITFWWLPFFVVAVVHHCTGLIIRPFMDVKRAYLWAAEQT